LRSRAVVPLVIAAWVIAGGDVAVSPALLLWVAVPPRLAP
jgi:hypothetical protein